LCGLLRIGFLAIEAEPRTKLDTSVHSNDVKILYTVGLHNYGVVTAAVALITRVLRPYVFLIGGESLW